MKERRANARYRVWFPMTVIHDEGDDGTAITVDVSASGLLMLSPSPLEPGSTVTLRLELGLDEPSRDVKAEILRAELATDLRGPWTHRMAVRFEIEQPDLEPIIVAASEEPPDDG